MWEWLVKKATEMNSGEASGAPYGLETPEKLGYKWLTLGPPAPWQDQEPVPVSEGPPEESLATLIEQESWLVRDIREQIRRMGEEPQGRTRAALAEQLAQYYLDPMGLIQRFSRLTSEERYYYVLQLLYFRFMDIHEMSLQDPYTIYDFTESSMNLLTRTMDLGLLLQPEERTFYIPEELYERLPPVSLPIAPYVLPEEVEVRETSPATFRVQYQRFLSLLQSGEEFTLGPRLIWHVDEMSHPASDFPWPLTAESARTYLQQPKSQRQVTLLPEIPWLSEDTARHWSNKLALPAAQVEFMYGLALPLRVVLRGTPVQPHPENVETYLTSPPGRQLVRLYRSYRNQPIWFAWYPLWHEGLVAVTWQYEPYWGGTITHNMLLSMFMQLRSALLEILAIVPQETWIAGSSLFNLVERVLQNASYSVHSYLTLQRTGGSWAGFLRLAVEAMVRGPLHWLGLADLALQGDELVAVRLHHMQDLQWDRVEVLDFAEDRQVQADAFRFSADSGELWLATTAPAEFIDFVSNWAAPTGLENGRLHYKLDPRQLHGAFESGMTIADLVERWQDAADFPLPGEIRDWWEHWSRNYGRIRFYPAQTALMARDEFTMHEVQVAVPKIQDAIQSVLTPQVVLLPSTDADAVLKALEGKGYMPKEES